MEQRTPALWKITGAEEKGADGNGLLCKDWNVPFVQQEVTRIEKKQKSFNAPDWYWFYDQHSSVQWDS